MVEKEVEVVNKLGLHARPAMMLVKTASQFQSEIKIIKDNMNVNAKSIMGVLVLAAEKGSKLKIVAEGPDEEEAVEALAKLFADGFGEE
ncbi:MAG TPA: HPr family phosphocarrier protein [candidate division Zixibacteria bacterium]|nr:HPr family phosphocarrier protein [candidate division Zixibacteria bacterium]